MIQLKAIKQNETGVRNQFAIIADEPIVIEFLETDHNHTVAHIYRGTEVDEHSEPIGAYDSAIHNQDFVIEE